MGYRVCSKGQPEHSEEHATRHVRTQNQVGNGLRFRGAVKCQAVGSIVVVREQKTSMRFTSY